MAFRRPWRPLRSSREAPQPSLPAIQERETATSWIRPFDFTRGLLVGLRNNVGSYVTVESELLPVIDRRTTIGEYGRTVTSLDFDSLVASITPDLKSNLALRNSTVKRPFLIRTFPDSSMCSARLS